ncbi:helix-turn-helix domain-containing protein [Candidatus Enterococcus ferrettii]|uniref:HTH araC/xylS-type domain-containing protein n=1 Tax=Candidatus Enterococcus ferrettii TaxID=2815324 RepID=A0ABV0ERQ8_9ENTE|nr:DUF6597 domain-containing transcriptional factor [Enterococcus sp. 665A]MBO1341953.1 helix-turn-helix domain-containing protein [Enterococcus sp. 665A]
MPKTAGYYPIQIPYLLSEPFQQYVDYQEDSVASLSEFVICCWQMIPRTKEIQPLENIIIADGCIDLVVAFDQQQIGFSGTRETDFHFPVSSTERFMGLRLKPGAFAQLFQRSAEQGMDQFLPIERIDPDFDSEEFFKHSFSEAKEYLIAYWENQLMTRTADAYTRLFDELTDQLPASAAELYDQLGLKERSCQRIFQEKYALSPKKVLSILRFQKGLNDLLQTNEQTTLNYYYDQSHFIQDFKRNIGITPRELIQYYRN